MSAFADIILPLAQPAYTFAIGATEGLCVGDAVAVQFGRQAVYTGIVQRLHDTPPTSGRVKSIIARLYHRPLLSPTQIRFWEWIADYYMCTIGEVMRMALPSTIKPHARNASEFEPYTPRHERILSLSATAPDGEALERMRRRAPRRAALIDALRQAGGELPRSAANADAAVIATLVKSGEIVTFERECEPSFAPIQSTLLPTLSAAQTEALEQIEKHFSHHNIVVLHGVTGSGKTEIYAHRIAETLARGEDVLYLVPEISLTQQLVARMRRMFGDRVTSYHSKLTPQRRTRIYTDLLRAPSGNFVIGARSALFLPFTRLGLVVVDEEHDSSYKQSEPAPRYNGRDAAVMLAAMHGAKSILGSATPALETYANTLSGKYGYVSLSERYGEATPPQIIISDTIRAAKRGERKSHFNTILLNKIEERLERGEQVMLFQNRRGYSPYVECPECGWTARCPHCNVTLSQHAGGASLRCHYCGYTTPTPTRCPGCQRAEVRPMGFGTERVEEEISRLFPSARVVRLDSDTATSDAAYERIISGFARHEADILVGTRIIAKGLDFERVTLIGILNADNLLNAPDFRAGERAWQTIVQMAGRCGRRDGRGEVIIQSADPCHSLLAIASENLYEKMATTLLAERQRFSYPPYTRLIRITLRDTDTQRLATVASSLGSALRERFASRVFGPVTPLLDRMRGEYIVEIMLKIEVEASFARAKQILRECIDALRREPELRKTTIICDVDFV